MLWLVAWPLARRRFLQKAVVIELGPDASTISRPGSTLSGVGVLFVFVVNIGTFLLVFAAAVLPAFEGVLDSVRVDLAEWVSTIGGALFVLYGVWGLMVLVYNPNYTPVFRKQERRMAIAMRGPYAIVRHPRYAGEAFMNIVLFLFTGVWIPLLGIVAWPAVRQQALSEEDFLMAVAPQEYGEYRSVTGMFLPRLKARKRGPEE